MTLEHDFDPELARRLEARLAPYAPVAHMSPPLARRSSRRGRVMAAALAAIYPWSFQFVGTIASENLFTPLALAALIGVVVAADDRRRTPALWAGVGFGLAALARNNLLVLAPPLALWWWWRAHGLIRPALFGLGIVLGLLPFAAYESAQGNGLVLGSSGGGLQFFVGNNPDAARFYAGDLSDAEWQTLSKRSLLGAEASELVGCHGDEPMACVAASVPPAEREAVWYRAALRYITSRPGEWGLLEARKFLHYWRPWVEPRVYSPAVVALSGFSFAGLVLLAVFGASKLPRSNALFIVAVAVGSTMAAVVWQVQLRYRFALLDPVLLAATGLALLRLIGWTALRFARAGGGAKPLRP